MMMPNMGGKGGDNDENDADNQDGNEFVMMAMTTMRNHGPTHAQPCLMHMTTWMLKPKVMMVTTSNMVTALLVAM